MDDGAPSVAEGVEAPACDDGNPCTTTEPPEQASCPADDDCDGKDCDDGDPRTPDAAPVAPVRVRTLRQRKSRNGCPATAGIVRKLLRHGWCRSALVEQLGSEERAERIAAIGRCEIMPTVEDQLTIGGLLSTPVPRLDHRGTALAPLTDPEPGEDCPP